MIQNKISLVSNDDLPASVRELSNIENPLAEGVLMKHQKECIQLCQEEDLVLIPKGRRTGITYAIALDSAITASTIKKDGGDNIYYIGDTKAKGLEFIGYCAHMAKTMAMADGCNGIEVFLFEDQDEEGNTKYITSYRIRFATGLQIVALSSNPANIRGLQGIVIIDEAAFHRNVQEVIDACLALLIWGGKIRIISTHNGAKNPFNQLVKDSLKGLYDFKVFEIYFDEAVENGLYERASLVNSWVPSKQGKIKWYKKVRGAYGIRKAAMLEELDGIPQEGSGVAIPGMLIENCMKEERPVLRLTLEDEFALKSEEYRRSWCDAWIEDNLKPCLQNLNPLNRHVFGSDYARHADFAEIIPIEIQSNLTKKVPFIIEMNNVPTRQQEQILWYMVTALPRFSGGAMDATGNGATLAEYTADKFGHEIIEQVMLSDKWYRDNMGKFADAFEDAEFDLPKNDNLLNDIRALQRINGIIKLPALKNVDAEDSNYKRHGDGAIALALGNFACSMEGGVIEFIALPSKSSFEEDDDDNDFPNFEKGAW